jgi:hypothetical protein
MGITVYLPPELEQQVLRVAKTRNLSASGIISTAVKNQFADNPNGIPEGVTRQLARVEARLDKVMRDNAVMKEAFFLYVRVWLEHSPPLDPEIEDAAADSAWARFERYLNFVREGLEPGGSVSGDWQS